MHKRLPAILARRVSIALLTGIILLLSAYGYLGYQDNLRQWHAVAEREASATLHMLALSISHDMHDGDHDAAHHTLAQFLYQPQAPAASSAPLLRVRAMELRDSAGKPAGRHGSGQAFLEPQLAHAASDARFPTGWQADDGSFNVTGPVLHDDEYLGSLSINFDTAPMDGLFKRLFTGYTLYLPVAACAALLLTLLYAHWMLRPLGQAIRVLPRIGEGNVATPALTARRDEYADLGRAIEFADRRIHESSRQLQSQQDALVEAKAELSRFKNTLDKTLDCVFMFAPDTLQFFYINAGAERQVGYSAAELNNMTVLDIKPEYDQARFRQLIAPLLSGAQDSITFETVHRHKNGSLIPVEIFLQYIASEDEPGRFVAIVRDISERKRVQHELEQHRQHLEELVAARSATIREQVSIINQTHDAVVTTDLDGIVTSWNGGAERMFGIDEEKAIGQHIRFVYPADQHQFLEQQIIAPLKARGEHETEVRMQRADGSEFFAHVSLSMLFDERGAPKGMVGYSVDITDRKRREALLENTTRQLQTSNRELESFCYTVSHDLRAPLRAIHGFSQVLDEDYRDTLDEPARNYLGRIRAGAENMGQIIDNLLELSRVTRCELKSCRVDLSALAERVVETLREREPLRNVEVVIKPDLTARGDEGLLFIMMENLLGNAWKYTGRTQNARIEFGAQQGHPAPVFYVRDNGAGFDMRYADKLFGTFERLHQAGEFPGTGIGLATVHRIVERHGGTIRGEGHPGHGACFYFSLPQQAPGESGDEGGVTRYA